MRAVGLFVQSAGHRAPRGTVSPPIPGSPQQPSSDPAHWGEAVTGTQAAAGSALILVSASVNEVRQGQRAGRCSVNPRA